MLLTNNWGNEILTNAVCLIEVELAKKEKEEIRSVVLNWRSPRGLLAMSENIFGCYYWGLTTAI